MLVISLSFSAALEYVLQFGEAISSSSMFVPIEIALSICGYLIGWLSDWFFYCLIRFFSPAEIMLY